MPFADVGHPGSVGIALGDVREEESPARTQQARPNALNEESQLAIGQVVGEAAHQDEVEPAEAPAANELEHVARCHSDALGHAREPAYRGRHRVGVGIVDHEFGAPESIELPGDQHRVADTAAGDNEDASRGPERSRHLEHRLRLPADLVAVLLGGRTIVGVAFAVPLERARGRGRGRIQEHVDRLEVARVAPGPLLKAPNELASAVDAADTIKRAADVSRGHPMALRVSDFRAQRRDGADGLEVSRIAPLVEILERTDALPKGRRNGSGVTGDGGEGHLGLVGIGEDRFIL